jgi:hypothetical protein
MEPPNLFDYPFSIILYYHEKINVPANMAPPQGGSDIQFGNWLNNKNSAILGL